MNIKEKYNFTFDDFLIISYFVSFWLRFFTDINFLILSIVWFLIGCVIAIYTYIYDCSSRVTWKILIIVDSIAFINAIINQNGKIASIVVVFIAQSFGVLLYKNKERLCIAEKIAIITIIYLMFVIFLTEPVKISSWEYGIVISKLLGGNSTSIVICMCLSIYILNRYNSNKKIDYWPFLIYIIITFKVGGNGGILSSLVFLVLIFFLDRKSKKISKIKIFVFSILALIVIVLGKYYVYLLQLITNDNSRLWMWSNYWSCAIKSFKNMFFGASVDSIEFLSKQKNMHNSYINWHYCFGLIPFLLYLFMILRSMLMYTIEKKHAILIISIVLFLRASTDEASFSFMSIWIYMWMDLIENMKKKHSNIDLKESG